MLLDAILFNLKSNPDALCCRHDKQYTNKEFYEIVCKAYCLIKHAPKNKPIVVYGHKEVYMIASFLACSFLGIPYIPIDIMYGEERTNYIIRVTNPSFIIGDYFFDSIPSISFKEIEDVDSYDDIREIQMKTSDTYYIIFTSGTTGNPKGVMVSYENVDSCVQWLKKVVPIESNYSIYNQAVFSFDLSVADIYLSLVTSSNHFVGEDIDIFNLSKKYEELRNSNVDLMVLTPSYAQLLCMDRSFNEELLPSLKQIVFCGEKLGKKLVDELYCRFPDIGITNMYGPTECTYAVTSIEVPKDCNEEIPIGYPKDDVNIYIIDNEKVMNEEEVGEILVIGKSVAKGYINTDNEKFVDYNGEHGYLTGDLGYYKQGALYYVSRKDSQIKYKGYRIELLGIENTILSINGVKNVKIKCDKDEFNSVKRIIAYIVLDSNVVEAEAKDAIIKALPKYMTPTIKIVDYIPLSINGKM